MKSKLIIAIVLLSATTSIQSQSLWDKSKPDNNFSFGVRGGVNFASSDMDYATSTRTGFHAGMVVDWNIIKSISVSSGLSYESKGFKSNYGKGDAGYLQVPLLLSYRIETVTGVQFHLNVGPYFAWGVSGKVDYKPYDMTFTYSYNQDSFGKNGFFKSFDTGLTAGAYIKLNHILLGVCYEYGMFDVAKVYGKFHNRNMCATLGYDF